MSNKEHTNEDVLGSRCWLFGQLRLTTRGIGYWR